MTNDKPEAGIAGHLQQEADSDSLSLAEAEDGLPAEYLVAKAALTERYNRSIASGNPKPEGFILMCEVKDRAFEVCITGDSATLLWALEHCRHTLVTGQLCEPPKSATSARSDRPA